MTITGIEESSISTMRRIEFVAKDFDATNGSETNLHVVIPADSTWSDAEEAFLMFMRALYPGYKPAQPEVQSN